MTNEKSLVVIATFGSRAEAEIMKNILKASSVESVITGDDAGGMYPPLGSGISLSVSKKDESRAREVINL